jgi:hypothetical protein
MKEFAAVAGILLWLFVVFGMMLRGGEHDVDCMAIMSAEQDPLQAVAAARTRRARAAGVAVLEGLVHSATAVAVKPCRLLVLSAADLRRFGRRVRGPLALLAAERRSFLQQRRAANLVGPTHPPIHLGTPPRHRE